MFSVSSTGSPGKTDAYLAKLVRQDIYSRLNQYGQVGVLALSNATPVESGETASSWYYEIIRNRKSVAIVWKNRHLVDGVPVAILLQYGHGTGTGGYVEGQDFINPAIKPVMDKIADDVWRVVTSA